MFLFLFCFPEKKQLNTFAFKIRGSIFGIRDTVVVCRYEDYLRQEVPAAVPVVSSDSHTSQPAGHPRSHQADETHLVLRLTPASRDTEQQL